MRTLRGKVKTVTQAHPPAGAPSGAQHELQVAPAGSRTAVHDALLQHLARFQTAPFLFVGPELSERYLDLPSVSDMLRYVKTTRVRPAAATMSAVHQGLSVSNTNGSSRSAARAPAIDSESSLKAHVAGFVRERDRTEPRDPVLRAELAALASAVIDGVITTTWDSLLERTFPDFEVYVGQQAVIRADVMGIAEVYRIHGSATDPDSLVLTRRDHHQFRERSPYFAAKILSAFTEHPVVFLGCSPESSDVVAILSSIAACLTADSIKALKNRLIFVECDPKSRTRRLVSTTLELPNGLSLPARTIRVADYRGVFAALATRRRSLPASQLRRLKQRVHRLAIAGDPQDQFHAQGIDDKTIDASDVVFGVGTIAQLRTTRHRDLRRIDLLQDLVLSDAHLDPAAVVGDVLPPILRHARLAPAFKYLRGAGLLDNTGELRSRAATDRYDPVREYVSVATARCLPPPSYMKVASVVLRNFAGYRRFAERRSATEMLWYGCLVPREMVELADLREFLRENWNYLKPNYDLGTQFLKLCCYYDMLAYRWPAGKFDS